MVINIIVLFLMLMIVPGIVGMFYTGFLSEERNSILLSWGAGYVILWGVFELVALPLIFQKRSLDFLCIIYSSIIVLIMIAAIVKNWRKIVPMVKKGMASIRNLSPIGWANRLLILGQAYVYVRYMHIDDDDAFYVGAATTAVSTNTIFSINPYTGAEYTELPSRYVLSPFFSFVAYISKISGVHPAVTAHVVLAAVLIILSYVVYSLIGKKMFPGNAKYSEYFLFFVIIVTLFSGYTVYTQGMFSLVRIWQGKAVFCAVLVPIGYYIMLHILSGQAAAADWFLVFMLMCACCMVSSMGIMLGAVMLGISGILNLIRGRKIKEFLLTVLCCAPNLVCAGMYLILR